MYVCVYIYIYTYAYIYIYIYTHTHIIDLAPRDLEQPLVRLGQVDAPEEVLIVRMIVIMQCIITILSNANNGN